MASARGFLSTMARSPFMLRARVVLPMTGPPIADGAVIIRGRRIVAVGRWRELRGNTGARVRDLGEVVLLPGLVNAHCHLDYTHMAGHLPPPKVFTDWLKAITELKAGWRGEDYEASWREGARMLLHHGTTTVADIEVVPELLRRLWRQTPLRILSFIELIGLGRRRPIQEVLDEAMQHLAILKHPRCRAGLSPHAPYSTVPDLLRGAAEAAGRRRCRLAIHAAESALEHLMFRSAQGEMYRWLQRSGRDMSDCGNQSPVQHLHQCGCLGPNVLAVHANYLEPVDVKLLARTGTHVVHCPRSHAYFRHDPFPLRRLQRAGVNVCLGTDSLASVYRSRRQVVELNLFDEMRALAARESWLSPRAVLRMATINGARALGLAGLVGQISPGAHADLIAVPLKTACRDVWEAVLRHSGPVCASLIDGQWAIPLPS